MSPLFQKWVPPPIAVNIALAPAQMIPSLTVTPEVSVTETDTDGSELTVMTPDADAVRPLISVTVTVYVVVTEGETVIDAVVAPVFHEKDTPPDAVSVALAPVQMIPSLLLNPEDSVMVTDTSCCSMTVMVILAVAIHPPELVTVTVYVVVITGFTVIEAVVPPVFHR